MSRGIDRPGMRVYLYDGAVRPARQHNRPREVEHAVPTALVWAVGAGRSETEEARLPLD